MAEFQVRPATPEDIAGVVALERATELLPHWAEAEYVALLTSKDQGMHRCLFIALSSSELVGFAMGMTVITGEDVMAQLENIGVAEPARRMGVASALCAEVIAWAHSRGAKEMELEVRSNSAGAIKLYDKLGFVAVGRRPGYYKEPEDAAVLMRLGLQRR